MMHTQKSGTHESNTPKETLVSILFQLATTFCLAVNNRVVIVFAGGLRKSDIVTLVVVCAFRVSDVVCDFRLNVDSRLKTSIVVEAFNKTRKRV